MANGTIIVLMAFKPLTLKSLFVMLAITKLLLMLVGKVRAYQLKRNGKLHQIILIGVNVGNGPKVLIYPTPDLRKKKALLESIMESLDRKSTRLNSSH